VPRIAGVDIPENKNLEIGLSYIYGIGRVVALRILAELKLDPLSKIKDLSEVQLNALRKRLDVMTLEGALRQQIKANIDRLKYIKTYRGIRHSKRLPVRGQQTKTNSRTIRGNVRRTAAGTSAKKSQPSPT